MLRLGFVRMLWVLAVLAMTTGCQPSGDSNDSGGNSGGNDNGSGDPTNVNGNSNGNNDGGSVLTGDDVLDGLTASIGALSLSGGTDLDADGAAILAVLEADPSIEETGRDAELGSVWGRRSDGGSVAIFHNRTVKRWSADATLAVDDDTAKRRASMSDAVILPDSVKAYAFNLMGPNDVTAAADVAAMLMDHGYDLPLPVRPSLAELSGGVTDAGVIYIDAHSGPGMDGSGEAEFYIQSATAVDGENDDAFAALLADHTLIKTQAVVDYTADGQPVLGGWVYAFNHRFVEGWTFDEGALVFANVCSSANGAARNFQNTMLREDGAETYLGWVFTVENNDAAAAGIFTFDRTLGENRVWGEGGLPLVERRTPRMRPMGLNYIFADTKPDAFPWEASAGRSYRESVRVFEDGSTDVSELEIMRRTEGSDVPILAPSIAYVEVEEPRSRIHILNEGGGGFGADPGSGGMVTVGGSPAAIVSWSQDEIVAEISDSVTGEVLVYHRGRRSNPRYLTHYSGINYEWTEREGDQFSLFLTARWENLAFRIDVDETWPFPLSEEPIMMDRSYPLQPMHGGATFSYDVGGSQDDETGICRETWVSNNESASFATPAEFPYAVEDNTFTVFLLQVQNEPDEIKFVIEPMANVPDAYDVMLEHITLGTSCGGGRLSLGGQSNPFANPETLNVSVTLDASGGWSEVEDSVNAFGNRVEYRWSAPSSVSGLPDTNVPK